MERYTVNTNKKLFATALLCLCTLFPQAYADGVSLDPTIPTLNYLYSKGESAIGSAYTLTPTQETTGENIINIPFYNDSTGVVENSYYKWEIKENVVSQPTLINNENLPSTNFEGHYINTEGIKNHGEMGNFYGDFIHNTNNFIGGAITNWSHNDTGLIGDIYGDFVKNTGKWGGGIYNVAQIGNITGNFIENYAELAGAIFNAEGEIGNIIGNFIGNIGEKGYGAIYNNEASIGDITGDFIRNRTISGGNGGAIYNCKNATVGNITGDFIENSALHRGGAIYNSNSTIESINGSFISNRANTYGGAIYNTENGIIGNITGNFQNNTAINNSGGAIYNYDDSSIGNITGDFSGNTAENNGGAINNISNATIGDITGNFENNTASNNFGGAILNDEESVIGDITGNFENNTAGTYGGAIFNSGSSTIGNIKGNFTNNTSLDKSGGAIRNYSSATIGNITGDFLENSAYTYGGAISNNNGSIGNITGNFTNNNAANNSGGAIFNYDNSTIDDITGNFNGNTANYNGGAIYNYTSSIGNITGDFTNNYTEHVEADGGGAIYNFNSTIGNITGNFTNNLTSRHGGAIFNYNDSIVGNITGDFSNNTASEHGGAIYNLNSVNGDIVGNFTNNTAGIKGGAIYNIKYSTIDNITGSFNNNTAKDYGGAIFNDDHSVIGNIVGNFENNTAINYSGGAIRNFSSTIGNITGDFISNTANTYGGAIYNYNAIMGNITGNFTNNSANLWGGAIYNYNANIGNLIGNFTGNNAGDGGGAIYNYNSTIGDIVGNFIENSSDHWGGAIVNNTSSIGDITGNFENNTASTYGGAIYSHNAEIENIVGNFQSNTAGKYGGAIHSCVNSTIESITGNFTNNTVTNGNGGAIYNTDSIIGEIDGSFINNFASLNQNDPSYLTNNAYGGAIYSNNDINLVAKDDKTNYIKGNTVTDKDGTRPEAIYMAGAESNLNIKTQNKGKWEISDQINGVDGYTVNMIGDGTGSIALYNDILNANVTINATNLSTMNNDIHTYHFNSFTVNGNSNMAVDVNLAQGTMDKITADAYGEHNGNINVSAMNLLSDSKTNKQILFAEEGLAQNVKSFGKTAGEKTQIASPVRMYDVVYSIHDDNNGYFEFTPGANINNGYNYFNPAVLATPIALQTGVQSVFNTTKRFAFTHSDKYAKLPSFERNALINQNKYAFGSTIFNQNLNYSYSSNQNNKGIWVKPYTAFESIPLKNGPEVTSITYGTFLGYDSDFYEHKNGWNSAWTLYAGYNGGQLDYKGGDASLNGGSIGFTDTFYKGNFWSAITATTGAIFGDISTRYGRDDTISVLGGLASRTGYNLEFNDGRFIIQPIMGLSYSFSNTFDYHNSAGVKIDAKPLHTLQINPALRFIGNTKSGWQPYASVGMVWNLLNETNVTADGYKLPEMHIKPYIEYGLGLQKTSSNGNFTGFGQALVRNGGRNGVALTFGFRYLLGKD